MDRILEPELMDDDLQCHQYFQARSSIREKLFFNHFTNTFPELTGTVADLGCGPGWIDIRLCEYYPTIEIDAYDGSAPMLALAQHNVTKSNLDKRIQLLHHEFDDIAKTYDTVISTDALHHKHNPIDFWGVVESLNPGRVFVMDLVRPTDLEQLNRIVRVCSTTHDSIYVEDFRNSLMAAFTVEELEQQLIIAGLTSLKIQCVGDVFKTVFIHS